MSRFVHTRKTMIVLAIVVAVVAIVIPTCRMVGCSMEMGGAMPFGTQWTPGFFADCGGEFVVNGTPVAVVPSVADALTLALLGSIVAALALWRPRVVVTPIRFVDASPPPPPENPRGERLRL